MAKETTANYITEEEVCQLFGIGKKSLRIYTYNDKRKKEPFMYIRYKKIGQTVVYSKSDVLKALNPEMA